MFFGGYFLSIYPKHESQLILWQCEEKQTLGVLGAIDSEAFSSSLELRVRAQSAADQSERGSLASPQTCPRTKVRVCNFHDTHVGFLPIFAFVMSLQVFLDALLADKLVPVHLRLFETAHLLLLARDDAH